MKNQPGSGAVFWGDTSFALSSDQILWSGVRRGDARAFRYLFQRYHKMVYNYAYRHTTQSEQAEDLTQATFAALWRRAQEGSMEPLEATTAAPILLAMTRHECLNNARSGKRRSKLLEKVKSIRSPKSDNVAQWQTHEAEMSRIHQALSELPDEQRAVIELVVWSGADMARCAEVLNIPVGTVKSRLARARRRLATSEIAHLLGE